MTYPGDDIVIDPPIEDTGGARILTLDIETSPNIAHVWGLFQQNVSLPQLQEMGQVIAFAAKWYGKDRILFHSDHHDGHAAMVAAAWRLLDEADVVVHYNGTKFDIPHLQREFVVAGLGPTSPFQQVDLLKVVRKRFRFPSNKLDHVSRELGLDGKVAHTGHDLWVKCMAGDAKAWSLMRRYNRQDVRLTEELYDRLRPWLTGHPNLGLWQDGEQVCPNCGSRDLQSRGLVRTRLTAYRRLYCTACGSWSRSSRREAGSTVREAL